MKKLFVLCLIGIISLVGCSKPVEVIQTENPSNEVENNNQEVSSIEEVTQINYSNSVIGEWKIDSAKTQDGEDISIVDLWGSSIRYGGNLKINNDGTYTEYIGISAEKEPFEGEWTVNDETLKLQSKVGNVKDGIFIDENTLEINYGDFFTSEEYKNCTVRFSKVEL